MGNEILTEVISIVIEIIGTLCTTALTIVGAWLVAKLGRSVKTKTLQRATESAVEIARQTAVELQQTCVEDWKASNKDGRLTAEEIAELKEKLLSKTYAKLSAPIVDILRAGCVDIDALISGAGEEYVKYQHDMKLAA
ncbi:MAG: hypothetical protein ACOX68_00455 [Candidatus Limivicinus sp.]|jgi:hypothetical protein